MSRSVETSLITSLLAATTRRELLKRAAAAGIAVPVLSGAVAAPGRARAQTPEAAGQPGGTMVLLGHQEIASLSPDDDGPSVHFVIVTQIHNGLLEMDHTFTFNPVLASALPEVSADGLTYTFTLVDGVLFHDGTPFTSADVKYTYEWYMNPENAAVKANNFASIASVEAPDPLTAIVTLTEPNAAFYPQVATTGIVPAAYHGEIGEDEYKGKPVGTGPFKLREWRAAEFTEIEAFDGHFRGRPYLDVVRLNVVPEASVRAIALETGDADTTVWPLVTEDSLRLQEDPNITMYVTSGIAVNHFPLNNSSPKLSDKRVRQAMLHAIDRQAVIDDIFSGAATIATANLSPALEAYYNPEVVEYPYDPERAAALLDEAGWVMGDDNVRAKDGERLSFVCTTITGDQARRPEAELAQQYFAEVGIEMEIEEAPVATILEQLRSGEMEASLFNWTYGGDQGDPDASTTLRSDGTNNFSRFNNPRVDELLDQGLREIDPAARAGIYQEIQQIVADEVPFLYMMYWDIFTPFRTRVQGLPTPEETLTPEEVYVNSKDFWVEES